MFVVQPPMPTYGEGLLKRRFLAIDDSMQCLIVAIEPPEGEYRIWNHLHTVHSMNDIANTVGKVFKEFHFNAEKSYMVSSRSEAVDDHCYNPVVNNFSALGFKPTRTLGEETRFLVKTSTEDRAKLEVVTRVPMPEIKCQ